MIRRLLRVRVFPALSSFLHYLLDEDGANVTDEDGNQIKVV